MNRPPLCFTDSFCLLICGAKAPLLLLLFVFLKTPLDKLTTGMVADLYLLFFLTFWFVWPVFGLKE